MTIHSKHIIYIYHMQVTHTNHIKVYAHIPFLTSGTLSVTGLVNSLADHDALVPYQYYVPGLPHFGPSFFFLFLTREERPIQADQQRTQPSVPKRYQSFGNPHRHSMSQRKVKREWRETPSIKVVRVKQGTVANLHKVQSLFLP